MKRPLQSVLAEERQLLLAIAVLVVLLNVPFGSYVLYPFALFATWAHELCHGLAALALGGGVERIQLFADTSGMAFTSRPPGRLVAASISSAGYLGCSVVGAGLLALRHQRWMARAGVIGPGLAMLLSAVLWVRNGFGLLAVLAIGLALLAAGIFFERAAAWWLATFLAATCCLNAVLSIRVLFSRQLVVAGKPVGVSDAQAVASALFLPYWFWAASWMAVAVVLTVLALGTGPRRQAAA